MGRKKCNSFESSLSRGLSGRGLRGMAVPREPQNNLLLFINYDINLGKGLLPPDKSPQATLGIIISS